MLIDEIENAASVRGVDTGAESGLWRGGQPVTVSFASSVVCEEIQTAA
ncbi:hypothetical protein MJ575_00575 [Klebsiella pneumoniae]|nr:hypothetical protein MJ575_00575 [Klebsiella pneumoniae]